MIRNHHQHVVLAEPLEDLADERVVLLVEIPDRILVLGRLAAARRRVPRVDVPPEHVLDAIGRVEDAHERSAAQPIERGEEHRAALAIDVVGLLQKRASLVTPSFSAHVSSARPSVEYGPMRFAR